MQDKMKMNTEFGPYDSKEEVESLQKRLAEVGFNIEVDGMYGKKTKRKKENMPYMYKTTYQKIKC